MMGFIGFELGAGGLDLGLNDGHGQRLGLTLENFNLNQVKQTFY
jgi:hypothetical protein